jgi:hypothetical protein
VTDIEFIVAAAREHYANVTADIQNASTRIEHLRLTALAQEAANLVTVLEDFAFGLVYSHSVTAREQRAEELSRRE